MNPLRTAVASIQKHLGGLTSTQKMLLMSLCVVAAMSMLLVSLYSSKRSYVVLLPGVPAAEQEKAATHLASLGADFQLDEQQRILVSPESRPLLLSRLGRDQKLPDDTTVMFRTLAANQNWMMPKSQLDQIYLTAVQNEMAAVIEGFPGIERARVFLSIPEPRGLGAAVRRPTAQVTVFTEPNTSLEQSTVDALADLVSGGVAGLDVNDVRVIDGAKKRRYRARAAEDFSAATALEQVARIEQRVQDKILEVLGHIDGVVVAVNAHVDTAREESREKRILPKGEGTESLLKRENTETITSSQATREAEPGVRSNAGMDIAAGSSGGGPTSNQESTETEFENALGTRDTIRSDPKGQATRIFVSVSVPRDWVAALAAQARAAGGGAGGGGVDAGPTPDEINQAWPAEQQRIRELVGPLVATAAGEASVDPAQGVVVSMTPVVQRTSDPAQADGIGTLAGGGGGIAGSLLGDGLVKNVVLGVLAAVSLAMMLMMVRKASRVEALPTPEEIVGIPPQLSASEVVGEAGEGESAIDGIEVDDEQIRSTKMLEQVSDMIRTNPRDAGVLFNRWVTQDT